MPNIQPNYNYTIGVAVPGMIVDMRNRTVISRELQSASCAFGSVVMRGTTDHTCQSYVSGGMFLGISVLDITVKPQNANADAQGDTIAVMTRGLIWVPVTANVTPGQPAFYDGSGNITNVASGNTAFNGVFESTAASGALAQLRVLS